MRVSFSVLAVTLCLQQGDAFTLPGLKGYSRSTVSRFPKGVWQRRPVGTFQTPHASLASETPTDVSKFEALPLPKHKGLDVGVLPNGLRYVLLPNASPKGRFEAHLELLAGSANELEEQQGMAHLVEHIAYMGSRKRERLFGTGSQTNAYTDFHHTVYYASCPVSLPAMPNDRTTMLDRALEALAEVLEARFEPTRLEKERAAVLSEMSMVNTIEYRVECAILQALHAENQLSVRFPIGLQPLIENWTVDDVKKFHTTHYLPKNAVVYLVGDLPPSQMLKQLTKIMGKIPATKEGGLKEGSKNVAQGLMSSMGFNLRGGGPSADTADDGDGSSKEESISLKLQSRHFPPILHTWSGGPLNGKAKIPLAFKAPSQFGSTKPVDAPAMAAAEAACEARLEQLSGRGGVIRIFSHPMLSSCSFHLFAKRPIVPVTTVGTYKQALATRIALAALQVRLNVLSRSEPLFSYVEFNVLDSAREACAVCSLDMMCDPPRWTTALETALGELRSIAAYGVTEEEMSRYVQSLLADSEQLAAQGGSVTNSDQLSFIMESIACGHNFMSSDQALDVTYETLSALTLEDVNVAAAELGAHLVEWGDSESPRPSAFIACAPESVGLTEDKLLSVIDTLCAQPISKPDLSQLQVPTSLLPPEKMPEGFEHMLGAEEVDNCFDTALEQRTPGLGKPASADTPVTLRRLKSGVRLNYRTSGDEPQRAFLRLTLPGGRAAEAKVNGDDVGLGPAPGGIALGARTMQEGGALGSLSRTQVELFCVDQLIMVEILTEDDLVNFNFFFPTNKVAGEGSVSGIEAVFQIVRQLLSPPHPRDPDGFVWEEDALKRAMVGLAQQMEQEVASLEGAAKQGIIAQMSRGDSRFLALPTEVLQQLSLEDAREALVPFLSPDAVEISISGDFSSESLEELAARYLGSLPQKEAPEDESATFTIEPGQSYDRNNLGAMVARSTAVVGSDLADDALRCPFLPPTKDMAPFAQHVRVSVGDSDPRAVAHVAGLAPNRWGVLSDGRDVRELLRVDQLTEIDLAELQSPTTIPLNKLSPAARRSLPLWPAATLALVQEVLNRRLFSVVRERKQLTYDANFQLNTYERLRGGWWLVTVTASPNKAQAALTACLETLLEVYPDPVTGFARSQLTSENLYAAQRVLVNKHNSELGTNKFWADLMAGTQLPSIPAKAPGSGAAWLRDWVETVNSITVSDLNLMIKALDLTKESMFTCVAISGDENADTSDDNGADLHGHTAPSLLRR